MDECLYHYLHGFECRGAWKFYFPHEIGLLRKYQQEIRVMERNQERVLNEIRIFLETLNQEIIAFLREALPPWFDRVNKKDRKTLCNTVISYRLILQKPI